MEWAGLSSLLSLDATSWSRGKRGKGETGNRKRKKRRKRGNRGWQIDTSTQRGRGSERVGSQGVANCGEHHGVEWRGEGEKSTGRVLSYYVLLLLLETLAWREEDSMYYSEGKPGTREQEMGLWSYNDYVLQEHH